MKKTRAFGTLGTAAVVLFLAVLMTFSAAAQRGPQDISKWKQMAE